MGICEIPSSSSNLIKDRKKYEIQLYQTVIKEYMSSKEKNLSRLIEYAVKLGVRDMGTIQKYDFIQISHGTLSVANQTPHGLLVQISFPKEERS